MKNLVISLLVGGLLSTPVLADQYSDTFFKTYDADGDGALTLQEFSGKVGKASKDACSRQLLKGMDVNLAAMFKRLDTDRDAKLSKAEFAENGNRIYQKHLKKQFVSADDDHNGQLNYAEYNGLVKAQIAKSDRTFSDNKVSEACKSDLEQWHGYEQWYRQYAVSYFSYMDTDGNSTLSFTEYKVGHL